MNTTISKFLLVLILLLPVLTNQAQENKVNADALKAIPVDPDVRVGKLDNGLTYFIRKNSKPAKKVEFRLVVNAGSILEDESQQGLAHFVEHMAFNGSKNFAKNELVDYLQSIGVEFGADLNAYTSFDETVYMLPIPTEDPAVVRRGLQVLEDWAHNITFSEEEIDKERGVVIEEWRLGRGANQRMRDKWFPVMFKNSQYSERLPIGKKEVIENASYETIKNFYYDWYRPDLMSVIAVGDLDIDEMEVLIKEQFKKIPARKDKRERTVFEVPDHDATYVAVVTDKESPFTQIQLVHKLDAEPTNTVNDLRRDLIYRLYNGMLGQRLNELRQSADPPFVFGGSGHGNLVRSKGNYSSFAMVGENYVEKGLNALLIENERVKKYGFTQNELDRYKIELLNLFEKGYKENDKSESRAFASEYIRSFLNNEPIPGRAYEYNFAAKVLPVIKLEEVNSLAEKWVKNTNRVVVVTGPDKEGVVMPTENEILNILQNATLAEIDPYEDNLAASELMDSKPSPGKIIEKTINQNLGLTTLTLNNGIKVVLKPTDFKNDEILMSAYSLGGHSIYPDEDYFSASYASQIISQSGVKSFSPTDLQKLFAGKTVRVSPFIGTLREGFSGSASPKDLETMFQLVYLYFTDPKHDETAFQSYKTRNSMIFQNIMSNPQYYFQDQLGRIMSQDHLRGGGFPTPEDMDKINFERAYEIYQERFANAGDFYFFFVGNFNVDEISPLLTTYLGSLPDINRKETWKDLGIRPPKGKVEKTIHKGSDQQSLVSITYTGKFDYKKSNNYYLTSLGELLTNRLIDIIREEKSGVYTVRARGRGNLYPEPGFNFSISFPCGPENVEELVAATMEEIKNIQENGVTRKDLDEIKEAQRIDRAENLKKNRYWLNQLNNAYYLGADLEKFYEYEDMIEKLTVKDIKEAANKYLSGENQVKVVLMPES